MTEEHKPSIAHEEYLQLMQELLIATYTCKGNLSKSLSEVIKDQEFVKKYDIPDDELNEAIRKVLNVHDAILMLFKQHINLLYNIHPQIIINKNYGK